MRSHNCIDHFVKAAEQYPDAIAIIHHGQHITYRDLHTDVKKAARYLSEQGVTQGSRILILLPMSIDLYRSVLALYYLGATVVIPDAWATRQQLSQYCDQIACDGYLGGTKMHIFALFIKALRGLDLHLRPSISKGEISTPAVSLSAETTALITFTTGSTGIPKAANRTHGLLNAQLTALQEKINPHVGEIDLCTLPIVLLINLAAGVTSVIPNQSLKRLSDLNIDSLYQVIKSTKVTRITTSPYVATQLAKHVTQHHHPDSQVRRIFTGGGAVFPHDASLITSAFAQADVTIVYGSTEAEPISSISATALINQASQLTHGLPVGKCSPYATVKILKLGIDSSDLSQCNALHPYLADDHEVGEIIVSGPHVLAEYLNDPIAQQTNKFKIQQTLWHRTGDSGYLHNGRLYLTGRIGQILKVNGETTYPFLIEYHLSQCPGITCGTLILVSDQLCLVVESALSHSEVNARLTHIRHDRLVILDWLMSNLSCCRSLSPLGGSESGGID